MTIKLEKKPERTVPEKYVITQEHPAGVTYIHLSSDEAFILALELLRLFSNREVVTLFVMRGQQHQG